jgi:hypothetical protein
MSILFDIDGNQRFLGTDPHDYHDGRMIQESLEMSNILKSSSSWQS